MGGGMDARMGGGIVRSEGDLVVTCEFFYDFKFREGFEGVDDAECLFGIVPDKGRIVLQALDDPQNRPFIPHPPGIDEGIHARINLDGGGGRDPLVQGASIVGEDASEVTVP